MEFRDGRKLVGWPKYFSATGKPRELFLADATWYLTDENGVESTLDVDGPGIYISDMSLVSGIEVLKSERNMGYIVDRPLKEGVGEKPTTPKPVPASAILIRGNGGEKPATAKPVPKRPVSVPATK